MVLSQSTDRWAGKGSGGRRCPQGVGGHQGGHFGRIGGHPRGHIGHHDGLGVLGAGGMIAAKSK